MQSHVSALTTTHLKMAESRFVASAYPHSRISHVSLPPLECLQGPSICAYIYIYIYIYMRKRRKALAPECSFWIFIDFWKPRSKFSLLDKIERSVKVANFIRNPTNHIRAHEPSYKASYWQNPTWWGKIENFGAWRDVVAWFACTCLALSQLSCDLDPRINTRRGVRISNQIHSTLLLNDR